MQRKPSSVSHRQQTIVSKPSSASYRQQTIVIANIRFVPQLRSAKTLVSAIVRATTDSPEGT
jgi:hypothetical protein